MSLNCNGRFQCYCWIINIYGRDYSSYLNSTLLTMLDGWLMHDLYGASQALLSLTAALVLSFVSASNALINDGDFIEGHQRKGIECFTIHILYIQYNYFLSIFITLILPNSGVFTVITWIVFLWIVHWVSYSLFGFRTYYVDQWTKHSKLKMKAIDKLANFGFKMFLSHFHSVA